MLSVIILFGIIILPFELTGACNGYTLKLNYVKNCDDDSIVQIGKGFDVTWDKDCNIMISGCLNFTQTVTSAKGRYTLKKPPMPPFSNNVDLCEIVGTSKISQLTQAIKALGIKPAKCPIQGNLVCGSPKETISIAEFKNQLGVVAGTTDIMLDLTHDVGKTCVKFSFDITKSKTKN